MAEASPTRKRKVVLVIALCMVVPFLLSSQKTRGKATDRVTQAVRQAEGMLAHLEIVTVADYQRFSQALKQIDASQAPAPVRQSLQDVIIALDSFVSTHEPSEEITSSIPSIVNALLEFHATANRWTGDPF